MGGLISDSPNEARSDMNELEGRRFRYWCSKRKDRLHTLWGFGHKKTAEMYCTQEGDIVIEVDIIIDKEGAYWALYKHADDKLHMIYPHESLFRVCFPYGPEVYEEKGEGKIVRCRVEEIE